MSAVSERDLPGTAAPRRPPLALVWLIAVRPRTLTIAVAPVLVAVALARLHTGLTRWEAFLATLLGAVLIQAGTNLYNDAGDFVRGADGPARIGPRRVTAAGWLTPAQVQRGAHAAFAMAALSGVYLVSLGGWPILVLGVASIVAGLAYTGGPRPIACTALGELFVFLFFGLVAVLAAYYLQTGAVSPDAALAAGAVGLHAAAVLTVNNHRDMDADRAAGRTTLAHRLGSDGTRRLFVAMVLGPYLLLAPLAAVTPWLAAPLLSLPLALRLCRDMRVLPRDRAQTMLMLHTVRLQLVFALLLSAGAVVARSAAGG